MAISFKKTLGLVVFLAVATSLLLSMQATNMLAHVSILPTVHIPIQTETATSEPSYSCAKISVIVPMTPQRMPFIPRLMQSIANGTRLPCEIIFSISSSPDPVTIDVPSRLQKATKVSVITTAETKFAGGNRNTASSQATMPVIAAIDSDDMAGPTWIETIEHVFQTYEVDALMHKISPCSSPKNESSPINVLVAKVNRQFERKFGLNPSREAAFQWATSHRGWHNGHISIRRHVYLAVQQDEQQRRGEDSWFLVDILLKGYKVLYVRNFLTLYCHRFDCGTHESTSCAACGAACGGECMWDKSGERCIVKPKRSRRNGM